MTNEALKRTAQALDGVARALEGAAKDIKTSLPETSGTGSVRKKAARLSDEFGALSRRVRGLQKQRDEED